jgi:hypothetical protein
MVIGKRNTNLVGFQALVVGGIISVDRIKALSDLQVHVSIFKLLHAQSLLI